MSETNSESTATSFPALPTRLFPEMTEVSESKQASITKFYDTVWLPYSRGETLPGDAKSYVWPHFYKTLSDDDARVWCYKLMIARKFDLEEAKKMLQTILEFRQEYNTERDYFPAPFAVKGFDTQDLIQFYGQDGPRPQNQDVDRTALYTAAWQNICFHKTTKWGHPVSYEFWGHQHPYLVPLTLKRLVNPSKNEKYVDVHLRFHVNVAETGMRLARYQDHKFAKPRKDQVSGILCVCDMTGLGMHHFVNEFIAYLSSLGEFDKRVYPEILHHVLVINCPAVIRAAFAIVSPLIDARTQTKISFHSPGEATQKILKEWIHDDDLPEMHGGKCKCDSGCLRVPNYEEQEKEYQTLVRHAKAGGTLDSAAAAATVVENNATRVENSGDTIGQGLCDVGVEVPAGKSLARELIVKKDEAVSWDWLADEERTVEFSVSFQGDEPSSPVNFIVKPDKIVKHTGSHTAEVDGKIKITFGNEFSWMRSKYLTLKTAKENSSATNPFSPTAVVTGIHIDGETENKEKQMKQQQEETEERKVKNDV